MKFCEFCENMLYVTVTEDNDLMHYCKNCEHKVIQKKSVGSICVIDDNTIDDATKYSQYINKYIKHDHTLPRVNNIECTNKDCKSKSEDVENEVIYIKYDFTNMKYIYYCCHCDSFWKPSA